MLLRIVFCALASVAVVPTAASASPQLTYPTGTRLAAGSKVTGTNVGAVKFTTSSFIAECGSAPLTGELTSNTGTAMELSVTSASFSGTGAGGDCTSGLGDVRITPNPATNGLPWCMRATNGMSPDEFRFRGNSCINALRPLRFVLDFTSPLLECVYEKTGEIAGSFTTEPEDARLSISGSFEKIEGGLFCPSTMSLDMTTTLEADTTSSSDPMYIS
ncbi:MAG TPA: hypothetical protein VFJ53_04550 [Solirubrobacterales bacterium]|nr:hypothetical protein [Solirubrobacterales bacterium]